MMYQLLAVQAIDVYNAGMQYTLRNIPHQVDRALRHRAKAQRTSLNQVAIEALRAGLGVSDEPSKKRDLSDLVGTLTHEDARAIEETVKSMDEADLKIQRVSRR